jgi:hypothetical protein
VNTHQLASDEPISPELVLVFPPELRAQVLADLPPPVWARRPRRPVERPAPVEDEPLSPSMGAMVVARVGQLALVFIAVTILVLAMSLVAQAMR